MGHRHVVRALLAAAVTLVMALLAAGPASAADIARPVGPAQVPSPDPDVPMSKLDRSAKQAPPTVGSWYVDLAARQLVVETTDIAAASAFLARAGAVADRVRLEQVAETPKRFADLVGGQAIFSSSGGRCSVGFTARSGSQAFVITAGHCTELGGIWSGPDRQPIGPVDRTSFPNDDFGTIRVDSSDATPPTSRVEGSAPVLGSTEAQIGAQVCRSGSTTGYRCGRIQARNATVNYGGGDIIYGLTRTNACAEPGDSGGSFVAGNQAQGLTSGGSGNCRTGGTTFFQPINEVLDRYGLTLVTG